MKFYSVSIEDEAPVPIHKMSIKQLETLQLCINAGAVVADGSIATVEELRDQLEIWLSAMAMVS